MGYKAEKKYIEQVYNMLSQLKFTVESDNNPFYFITYDEEIRAIADFRAGIKKYYLDDDLTEELKEKKDKLYTEETLNVKWEMDKTELKRMTDPKKVTAMLEKIKNLDDDIVKSDAWVSLYKFLNSAGTMVKEHEINSRHEEQQTHMRQVTFISSAVEKATREWNENVLSIAQNENLNINTLTEVEKISKTRLDEINKEAENLKTVEKLLDESNKSLTAEVSRWGNLKGIFSRRDIGDAEKEQLRGYAMDIAEMEELEKNLSEDQKQKFAAVSNYFQSEEKLAGQMPDKKVVDAVKDTKEYKAYLKAEKACSALRGFSVAHVGKNLGLADYKRMALDLVNVDAKLASEKFKEVSEKLTEQQKALDDNRKKQQDYVKEKPMLENKLNKISELKDAIEAFEETHGENLKARERIVSEFNLKPVDVNKDLIEQAKVMNRHGDFKKGAHINTKEFKNMMNSLKMVTEWNNKDIMDKIRDKNNNNPKTLEDAMRILEKSTQTYIAAKEAQVRNNPSALRISRLALADNILKFAQSGQKMIKNANEINKNIDELERAKKQTVELKGRVVNKSVPEKEIDIEQ